MRRTVLISQSSLGKVYNIYKNQNALEMNTLGGKEKLKMNTELLTLLSQYKTG